MEFDLFISSHVNWQHATNFGVVFGAKLITRPAEFRRVETLELQRVDR